MYRKQGLLTIICFGTMQWLPHYGNFVNKPNTISRDKLLTVLETFVNDLELGIIRMIIADTTLELTLN